MCTALSPQQLADKCGSCSEIHENTAGGLGETRKIKVNHIYEMGTHPILTCTGSLEAWVALVGLVGIRWKI